MLSLDSRSAWMPVQMRIVINTYHWYGHHLTGWPEYSAGYTVCLCECVCVCPVYFLLKGGPKSLPFQLRNDRGDSWISALSLPLFIQHSSPPFPIHLLTCLRAFQWCSMHRIGNQYLHTINVHSECKWSTVDVTDHLKDTHAKVWMLNISSVHSSVPLPLSVSADNLWASLCMDLPFHPEH